MELVTKILSPNFFSIYTDIVRIANSWKNDNATREKFDFNSFVKNRLMLLSKFSFKEIRNFDLSLCLRLQFLLQHHLLACLDEKSLQVYSQYLYKENKKLMFSIISNERNFKVIVKELWAGNYAFMDFLIEVFYALKHHVDMFVRTQQVLSALGFMDFITSILTQMHFTYIDGQMILDVRIKAFQNKKRFLAFLELILFFIYKNKRCFILHVFPNSSTITKAQVLTFLFTLPFQSTFTKCNVFVLRLLEIMVLNLNELTEDPAPYREYYANSLMDVVERYNLHKHSCFFDILEMLVNNRESNILKHIFDRIDVWPYIIADMQFQGRKKLCTTLLRVSSYLLATASVWPETDCLRNLLNIWLKFLNSGKNNLLTASICDIIRIMYEKDVVRIKDALEVREYAQLLCAIKA